MVLLEMTAADDFSAYESFVASVMRPEDFYTADELCGHILSGYVTAWWTKDGAGAPVGWCGMENWNDEWKGACNFLGVAVAPAWRNTGLALRLIRHVVRRAGTRPLTAYIQPGVETERLLEPGGFRYVKAHDPWRLYVREQVRL